MASSKEKESIIRHQITVCFGDFRKVLRQQLGREGSQEILKASWVNSARLLNLSALIAVYCKVGDVADLQLAPSPDQLYLLGRIHHLPHDFVFAVVAEGEGRRQARRLKEYFGGYVDRKNIARLLHFQECELQAKLLQRKVVQSRLISGNVSLSDPNIARRASDQKIHTQFKLDRGDWRFCNELHAMGRVKWREVLKRSIFGGARVFDFEQEISLNFKKMISRNRQQMAQPVRLMGQSPHKRTEPFPQPLKENFLPPNISTSNQFAKPLISPKNRQNSERAPFDRAAMDRALTHKPQGLRTQRSPHGVNTDRAPAASTCCNHPAKKAEFRVEGEQGEQLFCGRCAAQLATQGCKVESLSREQPMRLSKRESIPVLPQYEGEPIYHQILDILRLCGSVVGEHSANIERFSGLQQEYNQQVDLTGAFYDRLIEIIEEMKNDHLTDLLQEKDKYTQIADIENDNLRENIIEINTIRHDIEANMAEVLEGIRTSGDTAECKQSLDHYRQKLTLYRHQTEEQLDSLAQVTRYSQGQIDSMIASFEGFLRVMWDETDGADSQQQVRQQAAPLKQMNSAMTVKNIHQILPRGVGYHQTKRAFRNLQAQEEEEDILHDRKSPNFKKI